jgi:hypothetical protein
MVDRLRQSVEDLEPPLCPHCSVEMKWYQSILVKEAGPQSIAHFFHCPHCSRLQETRSPVRTTDPSSDPSKLSKPPHAFSCAA